MHLPEPVILTAWFKVNASFDQGEVSGIGVDDLTQLTEMLYEL